MFSAGGSDTADTTSAVSSDGNPGGDASDGGVGSTSAGGVKFDVAVDPTGGSSTDGCSTIDVLFIVDISGSMNEEKDNLELHFPDLVQVLDDYVLDPVSAASDYRIGVTNSAFINNMQGFTSWGLDGELFDGVSELTGDCNLGGVRWIPGSAPDVATKFACIGRTPNPNCSGCFDNGWERPLDAIEAFVEKSASGGVNEGFFRGEDSLLVIVMITDEDDDEAESTTTPAQTKAVLDAFTGGEERYVVVTIAGPVDVACGSALGTAAAAPRLHSFTNMVANGYIGDICVGDLANSLSAALELIQGSCDTFPPAG